MSVVADILMMAGVSLIAVATVGLHRFSDLYSRLHSASNATSAGFILLTLGALIHLHGSSARAELVIAAILLMITTPVGVHLLARNAYRSSDPSPQGLSVDELAARRKGPNAPTP